MFWMFLIVLVLAALFLMVDPEKSVCSSYKLHQWTQWKTDKDADYLQERSCKVCKRVQKIHKAG